MWMHGPFRNHEKTAYDLFYDLSAEACGLLGQADDLGRVEGVETARAVQVLHDILDLLSRLEKWVRDSDIVGFTGPFRFPDATSHHDTGCLGMRRYPARSPSDSGWNSDTLSWQMMLYKYWALRLDLCMTVFDNPVLRPLLDNSDDFHVPLTAGLETRGPEVADQAPSTLLFEECRKLANNIAVTFTGVCYYSATCQSFGSLVAVYILEAAIRWYEHHDNSGADAELEQHCRVMLNEIKTRESRDPFGFEVSTCSDQVLKLQWCHFS